MFCVIKYIDYKEFQNHQEIQEEVSEISCEYDNKTFLINPDCPIGVIRDYIATKVRLNTELANDFEMCTEKALLLDTRQMAPVKNGLEILVNQETYYLVLLNEDRDVSKSLLVPLLNRFSKEYMEFMNQQRRKSSLSKVKRRSSSKVSTIASTTSSNVQET